MADLNYHNLSSVLDIGSLSEPGTQFEIKDLIGEGTYGEVYEAFDNINNR